MIAYEHGSREGNGSRLEVDAVFATAKENGSFVLTIQPQVKSSFTDNGHPAFDADPTACAVIEMNVKHAAHLLMVLDGDADCVMNGKGLKVRNPHGYDIFHADRVWLGKTAPFDGYALHIKSVDSTGAFTEGRIILTLTEGASLRDAMRGAMARVAFADK